MSIATLLPPWKIDEPPPVPVRRFTVDEYQRMAQLGILTENDRVELLEGWIVPKMTQNPPHGGTIELVEDALRHCLTAGWRIRIQLPVTTDDSEPEPDVAVVRGTTRSFLSRHPRPDEVGLIVEVADTSRVIDRVTKARLYARAGIVCYWIVNLIDRQLEVFTDPSGQNDAPGYGKREVLGPDDEVPFVLEGREVARIAVRELLP